MKDNRRDFIKKSATLAAAVSVAGLSSCTGSGKKEGGNAIQKVVTWPLEEGANTPKLCVGGGGGTEAQMKNIKQMGINYILGGAPQTIPWKEEDLRATMDKAKANDLTIYNMMIGGHNNCIYGREGRDEEIAKIKESIVNAGKVGLEVIEYNWYIDRAMEGYYYKEGRGGSGITAYDYARVKDISAKPEIGIFTAEQVWLKHQLRFARKP